MIEEPDRTLENHIWTKAHRNQPMEFLQNVGKAGDRLGWTGSWASRGGWAGKGRLGLGLAWLGWVLWQVGEAGQARAGCKLLSDAKDLTSSSYTGYKLFSALKQ
ncbi:hypothetical protein BY996DRAFT_6489272 [Phakopsora pachyrhizi]|nr:hypothetical protein BY996DRAFT_6489272 [Phakopsora pachyrhizi]